MATHTETPSQLLLTGVVAVLRAGSAEDYLPVIENLAEAGVRCIELTLTTPGTIEGFERLRAGIPADMEVGIGTVTNTTKAEAALAAGADFLVTPTANWKIISLSVASGVPIYPGALTPTEVLNNWEQGAAAVKVFPAGTVGPDYFRQLRGPFPDIALMPSGGVNLDDIPAWMAAGAVAVSLGGPLLGDAFAGGDPARLRDRARKALDLVKEARTK
jgi:2-dehydro-3-deoxyphosphogluconate aldolase/(4S)-4-hydroxy-2-oxoglutarate aldolase